MELDRLERRLDSLQAVKPAFSAEAEELEGELEGLYQQYLHRYRCTWYRTCVVALAHCIMVPHHMLIVNLCAWECVCVVRLVRRLHASSKWRMGCVAAQGLSMHGQVMPSRLPACALCRHPPALGAQAELLLS